MVQNSDGDKKRFAGLQGKTKEQQNIIEEKFLNYQMLIS